VKTPVAHAASRAEFIARDNHGCPMVIDMCPPITRHVIEVTRLCRMSSIKSGFRKDPAIAGDDAMSALKGHPMVDGYDHGM
jgi:hypothetical protein